MKLILDETVFNDRLFVNYLLEKQIKTYLPALAYLEYIRQHLKKGNTTSMVDAFLTELKVEVVPLSSEQAQEAALMDEADYKTSTVAATSLLMKTILITQKPDTYPKLDQVKTPETLLKK